MVLEKAAACPRCHGAKFEPFVRGSFRADRGEPRPGGWERELARHRRQRKRALWAFVLFGVTLGMRTGYDFVSTPVNCIVNCQPFAARKVGSRGLEPQGPLVADGRVNIGGHRDWHRISTYTTEPHESRPVFLVISDFEIPILGRRTMGPDLTFGFDDKIFRVPIDSPPRRFMFIRRDHDASIFLRSLRSTGVTRLHRYYGRSDSCAEALRAQRTMNTFLTAQVSLLTSKSFRPFCL
ncbi:MAG: hypothetical protein L0Z55_00070, partial [Planctomycetes bacterium]|nr:hypothetical protein [Planctomycetota bacterium]